MVRVKTQLSNGDCAELLTITYHDELAIEVLQGDFRRSGHFECV